MNSKLFDECRICPRACGTDRQSGGKGYCGVSADIVVARAALHMWEEPCISGKEGSGTVFFAGCNLRCVFCQNHEISRASAGVKISVERLSDIFIELQEKGANNINLVTPTHFVPKIVDAFVQIISHIYGLREFHDAVQGETLVVIENNGCVVKQNASPISLRLWLSK